MQCVQIIYKEYKLFTCPMAAKGTITTKCFKCLDVDTKKELDKKVLSCKGCDIMHHIFRSLSDKWENER